MGKESLINQKCWESDHAKDPGPLFEQWAHRGQPGCSMCVCVRVLSLITSGLKRARGVTAFILSRSSSSSLTAGGLRTPSDHRTEAKVNLTPLPSHLPSALSRSHPSPAPTPLSLPPCLTFPPPRPLCSPVVLETRLPLRPPLYCVLLLCVCVCV